MFTNGQTVNMQAVMKDSGVIQKLLALLAGEKLKEKELELEEVCEAMEWGRICSLNIILREWKGQRWHTWFSMYVYKLTFY